MELFCPQMKKDFGGLKKEEKLVVCEDFVSVEVQEEILRHVPDQDHLLPQTHHYHRHLNIDFET